MTNRKRYLMNEYCMNEYCIHKYVWRDCSPSIWKWVHYSPFHVRCIAEPSGESRESHINTQQTLPVNHMRTIAVCMYVGMYMSIWLWYDIIVSGYHCSINMVVLSSISQLWSVIVSYYSQHCLLVAELFFLPYWHY